MTFSTAKYTIIQQTRGPRGHRLVAGICKGQGPGYSCVSRAELDVRSHWLLVLNPSVTCLQALLFESLGVKQKAVSLATPSRAHVPPSLALRTGTAQAQCCKLIELVPGAILPCSFSEVLRGNTTPLPSQAASKAEFPSPTLSGTTDWRPVDVGGCS